MPEQNPLHHLLSDEADDQLSIPLLSSEDEAAMERESTPEDLPILPLRKSRLAEGGFANGQRNTLSQRCSAK